MKHKTREEVLALAEKLDYQPDQVALSLVHKRTYTLGVVVPNVSFPYFSHVLSSAQEIAADAGYQVIIAQSLESYVMEKKVIQTMVANRVDGLLLSISRETQEFDHIHSLHRKGVPVILFDRVFGFGTYPQVMMDNFEAAYQVTQHLIEQGYQRIAHLAGPQRLLVSQQRLQGYLEALDEAGIPEDESLIIEAGFRQEQGYDGAMQLLALPAPPDAILCVSDGAAIGAKMALEESGIAIPHQMGLASFNNEPYSAFINPPLTTVSFPMREMGQEAIALLLKRLQQPDEEFEPEQTVLKSQLIIRKSSLRSQG